MQHNSLKSLIGEDVNHLFDNNNRKLEGSLSRGRTPFPLYNKVESDFLHSFTSKSFRILIGECEVHLPSPASPDEENAWVSLP
jgi:hypothetical protein